MTILFWPLEAPYHFDHLFDSNWLLSSKPRYPNFPIQTCCNKISSSFRSYNGITRRASLPGPRDFTPYTRAASTDKRCSWRSRSLFVIPFIFSCPYSLLLHNFVEREQLQISPHRYVWWYLAIFLSMITVKMESIHWSV